MATERIRDRGDINARRDEDEDDPNWWKTYFGSEEHRRDEEWWDRYYQSPEYQASITRAKADSEAGRVLTNVTTEALEDFYTALDRAEQRRLLANFEELRTWFAAHPSNAHT